MLTVAKSCPTAPAPSPRRRLAGFGIDWLLFSVYASLVATCVFLLPNGIDRWAESPWWSQLVGALFTTLPMIAYGALTESSRRQATIGKRVCGLQVVATSNGDRISLRQGLLRNVIKYLPWEVGHLVAHQAMLGPASRGDDAPPWLYAAMVLSMVLAGLWLLLALTGARRAPHDRLAGTALRPASALRASEPDPA